MRTVFKPNPKYNQCSKYLKLKISRNSLNVPFYTWKCAISFYILHSAFCILHSVATNQILFRNYFSNFLFSIANSEQCLFCIKSYFYISYFTFYHWKQPVCARFHNYDEIVFVWCFRTNAVQFGRQSVVSDTMNALLFQWTNYCSSTQLTISIYSFNHESFENE